MMEFPIQDLMDDDACYAFLLEQLPPAGLCCPNGHPLVRNQVPHMQDRAPVVDYRCRTCGRVFNAFTGTLWQQTHYPCATIVLILRGIAQGTPTAHLAWELGINRGTLLDYRHQMQAQLVAAFPPEALQDLQAEADEMYQNAGEKGTPHRDPTDPPRRRANKRRGHGTYATDRPPILGVVGRTSGHLRLTVLHHADAATLQPLVEAATPPETTVYTDEWRAYQGLARPHATVCHHPDHREWARDDDGDGIREVHSNTIEGIWTGLRNFLRPFRGVHQKYLQQYIAVFAWAYNLQRITTDILRLLLCPFISLTT